MSTIMSAEECQLDDLDLDEVDDLGVVNTVRGITAMWGAIDFICRQNMQGLSIHFQLT